jgi:hypothetical protein
MQGERKGREPRAPPSGARKLQALDAERKAAKVELREGAEWLGCVLRRGLLSRGPHSALHRLIG